MTEAGKFAQAKELLTQKCQELKKMKLIDGFSISDKGTRVDIVITPPIFTSSKNHSTEQL